MISTIAVIGAGNVGRSFALACVNAGFHVVLEDVMPANLRRAEDDYASVTPEGTGSLLTVLSVEDAARNADLAIDFVPDELESKLEIFSMLDRMAPPRTILLTPSDAQSITDLASCTYRADRCFALRGFAANAFTTASPVHLIHPPTYDAQALNATAAFLTALGCSVSVAPDPIAPMLIKNQPNLQEPSS